jgi:hypothetical protein
MIRGCAALEVTSRLSPAVNCRVAADHCRWLVVPQYCAESSPRKAQGFLVRGIGIASTIERV